MTLPAPPGTDRRATRVLLADDSDGLRLLVRSWLSTVDDLEVVAEARNGADAVALTDACGPDVVVLDVAMPVMDGLEALTELQRRHPSLPVVMLSGFAERDVADQAAARGACAFVEKSGDLDPLVDAVRRAAAGRPALPRPRPAPLEQLPAPEPAAGPRADRRTAARSALPTAAALLGFAALVLWRALDRSGDRPVLLLLAVPVLVLAVRHGLRGGLAAALAGCAAQVTWSLAAPEPLLALSPVATATVLLSCGAVAGAARDRLHRSMRLERQVGDAVVAANQQLAAANAELRQVNRALAVTNDDLRQFGYVVGHDLAEPLRTLRSFAALLEKRSGQALDERSREYLAFLVDGAARLQALVADLRAYTQTGQAELVSQRVELDDVLTDVRAALRRSLEERRAVVRCGPLPAVLGDRSMLGVVLQNLLANAVKFNASPAPLVEVTAQQQGPRVVLRVADDGIGVDPAAAERVFGLFSRLHTAAEYPGTGVGLAITKRIVERHDGTVRLAPREGGGTVVTLDLPAAPASR